MGMFDWVVVDDGLLPNKFKNVKFQSKNFSCMMEMIRLRDDGVYVRRSDFVDGKHVNIEWVNLKWRREFRFYGTHHGTHYTFKGKVVNGKLVITKR